MLRQGIPEIGVLGVALFVAFAGAVIWGLVGKPGKLRVAGMVTDCRMWLAAPLMFELLRIPVDIAIRSFLASGLAWFFAGYFYARPPKGEPLLPAR